MDAKEQELIDMRDETVRECIKTGRKWAAVDHKWNETYRELNEARRKWDETRVELGKSNREWDRAKRKCAEIDRQLQEYRNNKAQ